VATPRDDRHEIVEEFEDDRALKAEELITKFDKKCAGTPTYTETVVRQIQRPSGLRQAILVRDGTTCRICGYPGFQKKSGGMYAETHHMIEINKQAPNTLQSWNVIVVCPLCHKKLHHADVMAEFLNPGWMVFIDGEEHTIE
jgi:5-methylcytosine-specific restriction protein A